MDLRNMVQRTQRQRSYSCIGSNVANGSLQYHFSVSVHTAVNSLSFVSVPSDARKNELWLSKLPTINVKVTGNKEGDRVLE